MSDLIRRPSDAALTRAGALLFRELERLAIEDAEQDQTRHNAA